MINKKSITSNLKIDRPGMFLICLVLAAFFWVLSALSKTITHTIIVPIQYVNLPDNKIPKSSLVKQLKLTVEGPGFNLVRFTLHPIFRQTVPLNVEDFNEKGILNSFSLTNQILSQLDEIKIINIFPETINLDLDEKITKSLKVVSNSKIDFDKSYFLKQKIQLDPQTIQVTGPKSILDSLKFWETDSILLKNVKTNLSGSINLQKPENENISLDNNSCKYQIFTDQWTQKSFQINISTQNLPEDLNVYLSPKKAKVSIQLPISEFEHYEADLFEVSADFKEVDLLLDKSVSLKVNPTMTKLPKNVKILSVSPPSAEFLVYK